MSQHTHDSDSAGTAARRISLALAGAACRVVLEQMDRDGLSPRETINLVRWILPIVSGATELPGALYQALRSAARLDEADPEDTRLMLLNLASAFEEMAA